MAKNKHDVGIVLAGKSAYGSHANMVVDVQGEELSDSEVFCKDERGIYKTLRNRLDNGLSDANRWSLNRKNY